MGSLGVETDLSPGTLSCHAEVLKKGVPADKIRTFTTGTILILVRPLLWFSGRQQFDASERGARAR